MLKIIVVQLFNTYQLRRLRPIRKHTMYMYLLHYLKTTNQVIYFLSVKSHSYITSLCLKFWIIYLSNIAPLYCIFIFLRTKLNRISLKLAIFRPNMSSRPPHIIDISAQRYSIPHIWCDVRKIKPLIVNVILEVQATHEKKFEKKCILEKTYLINKMRAYD